MAGMSTRLVVLSSKSLSDDAWVRSCRRRQLSQWRGRRGLDGWISVEIPHGCLADTSEDLGDADGPFTTWFRQEGDGAWRARGWPSIDYYSCMQPIKNLILFYVES